MTEAQPPADAEPEKITFEDGYENLKQIVDRLGEDDVPIHELFDLLRRGKGLEKSLREYLETQEGELSEIEAGNSIESFEIVAPAAAPEARNDPGEDDFPF